MPGVFSQLVEFFSRLWLVNVPTYLVTEIPEISVCVTYLLSYILIQNVGFLWAFLVNASFAVACQVAAFLPFQDGMNTYKLVGSFYLVYSSVRVITYFAANMGRFAVFCLQNFNGIEKIMLVEREYLTKIYHAIFGMLFFLELLLIFSEVLCSNYFPYSNTICHDRQLRLLTQECPDSRRLLYCLLSAVVISLWQVVMLQFPRWNKSISSASMSVRARFQITTAVLSSTTVVSLLLLNVPMPRSLTAIHDQAMCVQLLGWTLALYFLVPLLISAAGDNWTLNASPKALKRIFLIICMSQGFFIVAYVLYRSFFVGLISGQLEFVVACFCLPCFWIMLAMLSKVFAQSSLALAGIGMPIIAVVSLGLSRLALMGGDGSAILMFFHAYGKAVQLFGYDMDTLDHEDYPEEISYRHRKNTVIDIVAVVEAEDRAPPAEDPGGNMSPLRGRGLPRRKSESSLQLFTPNCDNRELKERGQAHSTLVSAGIPPSIVDHWFVRMCRVTLRAWGRIVRALAVTDSILSAIVRIGIAIAASISIVLAVIGVCSVLQRNGGYYMKLLSYHRPDGSDTIKFNHIISNSTISLVSSEEPSNFLKPMNPRYAACSLRWDGWTEERDTPATGLTLVDLALLSEIAYIDDDSDNFSETKATLDDLFPGLNMTVVSAPRMSTEGPKFLEVTSNVLNITVIAVRGTDPGRFYDFLEDVALYSESASYHLLTLVFPTMRLWSGPTISQMIEWLCGLNRYFGLQPESRYYSPLVQRVRDIELTSRGRTCNSGDITDARKLVLTGHSLGGGLARIVGTMTKVPSVSISPPGLAMSFKKYNFLGEELSLFHKKDPTGGTESIFESDLHHESFAVVTEYDWIPQVDGQVGMVQKIQCDKPEASHKNACHMLEGTICHLLNHCGDARQRFRSCQFDYDLAPLRPWVAQFLVEHKLFLLPLFLLIPLSFMAAVIPDII